ncbi:MAG: response regulator [Anaerolineales bacterium]
MDVFANPKFGKAILGIAEAYGSLEFWTQNLAPGMNPDATWRALLLIGVMKQAKFVDEARRFLISQDSRVRAWACFALGQIGDESALEQIYAMNADPSNRVRIHAWQAVQAIVGPEEALRHFQIRIPTSENLVLISEDSKHNRAMLINLYRKLGFQVKVASSEQETIQLAHILKPQAIVTDNQKDLDNLSGLNMTWDLCRQRELRESIIFMLSADFVEPIFLWYGGDCFLSKYNNKPEDLVHISMEYLHH